MMRIDASPPGETLAVQRRRESRKAEWNEHIYLAGLLSWHLDPTCTFWTSLENKPISRISGIYQKRRNVRAGLPDVMILYRGKPIFIELKSWRGVASQVQKQIRAEMLPAGASWYMARSARAALMALHLEGVVFRRRWKPPKRLQPWEGPFSGAEKRLPQHPVVAAERAAATRAWRERHKHARESKMSAAGRNGAELPAARDAATRVNIEGATPRTTSYPADRLSAQPKFSTHR